MDTRPTYDYAQAGVLKRTIRRTAGWKPLSLFYARTLHLIDRASSSSRAGGPRSRPGWRACRSPG